MRADVNEYERVRRAVEEQSDKNENELRNRLLDEGYDPALVARALADRRWRRDGSERPLFGTAALLLGYVLYGVFASLAFSFLITRPGGAQPPAQGLILAGIVLLAAMLLAFAGRPGVAAGLLVGLAVLTLVSNGGANLLSDRYETVERSIFLYPLTGAVGALFLTLLRRIP